MISLALSGYTYITNHEKEELFDETRDPGEQHNLAGDHSTVSLLEQLSKRDGASRSAGTSKMMWRLRNIVSKRASDVLLAVLVAAVLLAALLGTSRDYAMAFDEGFTVHRERILARWFAALVSPPPGFTRADVFSREAMERFWPFSRKEPDGHPPFYALLGLAGWRLVRDWVDPLTSYRLGPMALTAATAGFVYLFLAQRRGRLVGLTAAGLFVLLPRTFAHAHYAHYDMPVTCLWILTQVAFLKSLRTARWSVPFGILLGLAAGTKFTGWFALAPPLAWTLFNEWLPWVRHWLGQARFGQPAVTTWLRPPLPEWRGTRVVALGMLMAALTLYAIQPPWWSDPIWGVQRFLDSNLSRARSVPVPSLYLGKVYLYSLPWHNTIVLTAVTTPVLVLILGLLGIGSTLVRAGTDREGLIWVLSWAVLMLVRALPIAPGHDVERLFCPAWPACQSWLAWGSAYSRNGSEVEGSVSSHRYLLVWRWESAPWGLFKRIPTTYPTTISPWGTCRRPAAGLRADLLLGDTGPRVLHLVTRAIAPPVCRAAFPLRFAEYHAAARVGRFSQGCEGSLPRPGIAPRLRSPAQPGHVLALRLVAGTARSSGLRDPPPRG